MTILSADRETVVSRVVRTELSVAFEAFWRALPSDGLVPHRSAFRPERAVRFLRHIVLCEALGDAKVALRIRLIGSEFEQRIQRNIKGEDYLQYLPAIYHEAAVQSVREIVRRPCGLWQLMPVHYERGYSQNVEITVLPLAPGPDGVNLLLILTQATRQAILPEATDNKAMATGTALAYRYIDLGAGVPD